MPFFGKKPKPEGEAATGISSSVRVNNPSLARIPPELSKAQEEDTWLVQSFLDLTERQTVEINELKHQLTLKESALHDCLTQINIPICDPSTELQRKTQEVDLLRTELQKQDTLFKDQTRNGQQELKEARASFEVQLRLQQDQRKAAIENYSKQVSQKREEYASSIKDLHVRLSVEIGKSAGVKDGLEIQLAEERRRFDEQILAEKGKVQAVIDEAESRAQQSMGRLRHEVDEKGWRIRLLEEGIREFAEIKVRLENQASEERQKFEEQTAANGVIQTERDEARSERDTAQSQLLQLAEQLGEEMNQKVQRIQELEEQGQSQTETMDQTRLALNRARNELNEQTRKARRAIEENATRSRQLEFVQQQCARMQDSRRQKKVGSSPSQPDAQEDLVAEVAVTEILDDDSSEAYEMVGR